MRSGKFSDLTSMFDRVLVTPIAGSMHDDVWQPQAIVGGIALAMLTQQQEGFHQAQEASVNEDRYIRLCRRALSGG